MGAFLSTKFDPATDIPDLTGKVIIVTGGNTGIGYATIKHLARHGAKVYMAARNESKATGAIASLEAEGLGPGHGQVLFLKLDLSDPRSAKAAAQEFLTRESRLDVLVNNAALFLAPPTKIDGVLQTMVVNHISPFVFTQHLLPLLRQTSQEPGADVRIVNVSSEAHRMVASGTRFRTLDDFNREFANARFPRMARYALSKLANILWTKELQKRLDTDTDTDTESTPTTTAGNSGITALAVHPGVVNTFADQLPASIQPLARVFMRLFFKTWDQGAYNSAFCAASPLVRERLGEEGRYKGVYVEGHYGVVKRASKDAEDPAVAAELWETTERFLESIGLGSGPR